MQLPVHVECLGNVDEAVLDLLDIALMAIVETEHGTHEELAAELVVELRHFTDIASVACQV
ncbi:hypothetical protein D3C81_2241300 [compost metagenome]